ncbi:hypothetical protein Nepgr_017787 [Nepenthes gracilis]|uniref:Uncharacterized protein n=1 Tax=Nepenthes gracilis TaxID=150966 RepID=A0AAD3XTN8_NEPGR|nr:hypothetical protein Nepgr_017787 [Nepenthes gracilis]
MTTIDVIAAANKSTTPTLIWGGTTPCLAASVPLLNPFPYATDLSDLIRCLKNSPSFLSNYDCLPFLDDPELVSETNDDDGNEVNKEEDELASQLLPELAINSESSHI